MRFLQIGYKFPAALGIYFLETLRVLQVPSKKFDSSSSTDSRTKSCRPVCVKQTEREGGRKDRGKITVKPLKKVQTINKKRTLASRDG